MNGVGEPCAGEPHARFEWGRLDETPSNMRSTPAAYRNQRAWTWRPEGQAVKLLQPPYTRCLGPVDPDGGMSLNLAPCFTRQRSQQLRWKYIHLATEPSRLTRPHPYHRMMSVSAIGWQQASQTGSSPTRF
jgi:hypothetical protein